MSLRGGTRGEDLPFHLDTVRMAEDYGIELVSTGDSHLLLWDTWAVACMLATATRKALIGPMPTNPVTRHPAVAAAALATLDAVSRGRAMVCFATGDSAVYNIGMKPSTRAHLEEYIICIRDLLKKGEATYEGKACRMRWPSLFRRQIPIWVCAEGPRMLHLAGRIADGVLVGTGLEADVIQDSLQRIAAGAQEAGRDPTAVDVWWTVHGGLADTREEALQFGIVSVSSGGNHSNRFGLEGKLIPKHLEHRVREYVTRYDPYDHMRLESGNKNVRLMEELGLTQYFLDRFAVVGTAEQWVDRIHELAKRGATKLWFLGGGPRTPEGQRKFIRVLGEQIMPHFRA